MILLLGKAKSAVLKLDVGRDTERISARSYCMPNITPALSPIDSVILAKFKSDILPSYRILATEFAALWLQQRLYMPCAI